MGVISPVATDTNGKPIATGTEQVLGEDQFLQLLVKQMQYQDPLDPMSNEEWIAQLAEFSSLEQLSQLNDSLSQSLDWDYLQMQTINNTNATSLIGKDVTATYSTIYLDDDNMPQIAYNTTEFAQKVTINISDADGNVVRTIVTENVEPGQNSIAWDGRDKNGDRLEDGFYTVDITGVDANGEDMTPSTYLEGRVTGVVYRDGSAYLKVNGVEVPLSEVNSIDDPTGDA